jgi:hypothetical protein
MLVSNSDGLARDGLLGAILLMADMVADVSCLVEGIGDFRRNLTRKEVETSIEKSQESFGVVDLWVVHRPQGSRKYCGDDPAAANGPPVEIGKAGPPLPRLTPKGMAPKTSTFKSPLSLSHRALKANIRHKHMPTCQ